MLVNKPNLVLLVVLDGWGIAPPGPGNAIATANTPNYNRFWASYPHTELRASGEAVGLPTGEVGNTETGHLNIGAGRIVYQDLARINIAIADGSFLENEAFTAACDHANQNNSALHLMGLLGAGGTHSSMEHLFALISLAHSKGVSKLFIHVFTDGRDSPPNSALSYISQLEDVLNKEGVGKIATIMGRYFAMDRDQRWERTEKAYECLTEAKGDKVKSAQEAVSRAYEMGLTDEFIVPTVVTDEAGRPLGTVGDNDSVIIYNFRIDRPRQLTYAFIGNEQHDSSATFDFDPYSIVYEHTHLAQKSLKTLFRGRAKPKNIFVATMTEYTKLFSKLGVSVAFPPVQISMPLGKVLSQHKLRQLRAAESEKERFVTYYFNGQSERADEGEERLIVPSPKVATYDLAPEMSVEALTQEVYTRLASKSYTFCVVNFANPDMVGHTGNFEAGVKAVESADRCIGRLGTLVLALNGTMLITGDHGNVEEMVSLATHQRDTEHSSNPVPFIAVSKQFLGKPVTLPSGILADIAPTVLALMGIEKPNVMTGRNLLASLMKKR